MITEVQLKNECNSIVLDIVERLKEYDLDAESFQDFLHEDIDGHQWIIYTYYAKQICCNCDTSEGEELFDEWDSNPEGFNDYVTKLAYCVLYQECCNIAYDMDIEKLLNVED